MNQYREQETGHTAGAMPGTGLFFVVNPASHSGKGMKLWKQVKGLLLDQGISHEVRFSKKQGDIARIVRTLTSSLPKGQERTLVILGGDGTFNEALQGLVHPERVRLGYIPTGSSNDLARDLKIGKDVKQALELALTGRERPMDLGCVTWHEDGREQRRYFAVSCGIGFDAAICREALSSRMKDWLNGFGLGKLTYLGIGLKQMLTARTAGCFLRLDGQKAVRLERMLFIASMSHRYEGGGFCFCPQARDGDGLLDLCVVNGVPKRKIPVVIPFALFGKHFRFRGVNHYRAARIEIRTDRPLWVHTDGEVPVKTDAVSITAEKGKLRFVCEKETET